MPQIAGNQTGGRDPMDDYPTDPRWTKVLLGRVILPEPVWECAAGEGAMVRTLRDGGLEVLSSDLVRDGRDFLVDPPPGEFQAIVTNPPYRHLGAFVARGLEYRPEVLALLVGLHFLGGAARARELYSPTPPSLVIVIPERMVVRGQASQFNHCWLVWQRGKRKTTLEWRHA